MRVFFLCVLLFLPLAAFAAPASGLRADGKTDVTAALQAALDAAGKAGGGTVSLGPGHYLLAGSVRVPTGVTLQGSWQTPHYSAGLLGSVLLVTGGRGRETGPAAIEMAGNCAVRGLTLAWPDQAAPGIVPYPFAIHGQGEHVTVEDITLVNAYQGIAIGPEFNELHVIRDVYGCPLKTGLWIDNCSDIGRVEDIQWNPHYWARAGMANPPNGDAIIDFERHHLDGFVFGRTDWEYVSNTFVFGAQNGYRFIQTKNGAGNGQLTGIGSDGGPCSVRLEAAQPMGWAFTNGEFVAMAGQPAVQIIADSTYDAAAEFLNCTFWGPSDHEAALAGHGSYLFQNCNFRDWHDKTVGAINATGTGKLSVQGCLFAASGPSVTAAPTLAQSIVTGNLEQK